MTAPIIYRWDGETMVPLPRFHNVVNAEFVVGELYRLDAVEERSMRSHRHYFAALHSAWMNLTEDQADRFATSEHLRKFALIKAGYHDERTFVAASKAEALRLAAFVRPIDDYAVVTVSQCTVTVYTAKSQSVKAMGAKVFQESKTAVLDYVSGLIGVDPSDLRKEAA